MIYLLLACTGPADKDIDTSVETGTSDATIADLSATVSPVIPTVVTVAWTTDTPTTGHVVFGADLALTTPPETTAATEHSAILLGLPASTETTWQVVLDTGATSAAQTVTTGILSNALPTLTRTGDGHDRYTVVPILGGVTGPSIIDKNGEFVWFYEDTRDLDVYRARLSRDGTSVYYNAASVSGDPSEDSVLVRVSLDGTQVDTIAVPLLAHDFVELPDGTLTTIATEYREVDGVTIRGDKLVEIAPDGTQTDVWSAWDCFDPAVDIGTDQEIGWTFANALDYSEAADTYYLSIRHFSSIVAIPRGGRTCDWVFGTTGATLPTPEQPFLHEHQFHVLDNSILVFDNAGAGATSRAIEYAFDPTSATPAETIWSYTPSPSIFTFVLGDVARLEGGDTMVDFAVGGEIDRVTPGGDVVWKLNTELGYAFGFFEQETDLYAAE